MLIEAGHTGQAFSFIVTLEAIGGMVEGLVFQRVFAVGIEHGEHWITSPFWLGAVMLRPENYLRIRFNIIDPDYLL